MIIGSIYSPVKGASIPLCMYPSFKLIKHIHDKDIVIAIDNINHPHILTKILCADGEVGWIYYYCNYWVEVQK